MACAVANPSMNCTCDRYLAPALVHGAGMGVFAGRPFLEGEQLEEAISIFFPKRSAWMLEYYQKGSYSTDPDEAMIEFGPAMMYNYSPRPQMDHYFGRAFNNMHFVGPQIRIFQHLYAHSVYPSNHDIVAKAISVGEEIFTDYGDEWFPYFGMEYSEVTSTLDAKVVYTVEELESVGQCMTHVRADESLIPNAGKGIFAKKAFKKGELIQVSPVLVLPKHEVIAVSDEKCVLINYCISRPDSDVALLPINHVGLCNHDIKANAAIEWFFWSSKEQSHSQLDVDPDKLVSATASKLFLGYRATRDIQEGEEITINYGAEWEQEWADYMERRKEFRMLEEPLPLFRRAIDAPAGFFPSRWLVDCIGSTCPERREEL